MQCFFTVSLKMSSTQSEIKRGNCDSCSKGKASSRDNPHMSQMLKLANKNIKSAIATML